MNSSRRIYLALGLITVAIVSIQAITYYHYLQGQLISDPVQAECNSPPQPSPSTMLVSVNALVNYGNGTARWYNETNVPADWNFYLLTVHIANCNVGSLFYGPPLNEHYITSINGLKNAGQTYWTLWTLCQTQPAWSVSEVGADLISLRGGGTFAWAYETLTSVTPSQSPVPGAKTVGTCP